MQIALIADTHGTLDPRIATAICGADVLVHAGDVGTGVADEIAALSSRVVIVHGNNDPDDAGWPAQAALALDGGRLVVTHGHAWPARTRHARLRAAHPDARAIVCGHSHRRVLDMAVAPWVLNPGAAGRTRAYGGPGYITIDIDGDDWSVDRHDLSPMRKRR